MLARRDEGSIAVMAAVIAPIVMLVVALALATLVWAVSETETQRASDEAAVRTGASALLLDVPPLTVPASVSSLYPTLAGAVPAGLAPSSLPTLSPCETVGNPVGAVDGLLTNGTLSVLDPLLGLGLGTVSTLNAAVTGLASSQPELAAALASLPATCTALTTSPLLPAVPSPSRGTACDTAEEAMRSASYAPRFYAGGGPAGSEIPTCDNGRVRAGFASSSPLVGFGDSSVGVNGELTLRLTDGIQAVQSRLAEAGVRLDSAMPNALCPQVDVEVDQPVREPVFDRATTPNGRASAKRVVKNAVVVPVFNGLAVQSATLPVTSMAGGTASVSGSVSVPAQNLNPALLEVRNGTLGLLDELETRYNALTTAVPVTQLNGTLEAVSAETGGVLPTPSVSAELGSLNLLTCLKNTVAQVFDPPGGDPPPTVQEIFDAAAESGDPVHLIQVGVVPCSGATSAVAAFDCVRAATGASGVSTVEKVTGVYDVPFFDITPVLLEDVGSGNYRALPIHATQASGGFRATLVRSSTDPRYVARAGTP